jgi:hypothetical protein
MCDNPTEFNLSPQQKEKLQLITTLGIQQDNHIIFPSRIQFSPPKDLQVLNRDTFLNLVNNTLDTIKTPEPVISDEIADPTKSTAVPLKIELVFNYQTNITITPDLSIFLPKPPVTQRPTQISPSDLFPPVVPRKTSKENTKKKDSFKTPSPTAKETPKPTYAAHTSTKAYKTPWIISKDLKAPIQGGIRQPFIPPKPSKPNNFIQVTHHKKNSFKTPTPPVKKNSKSYLTLPPLDTVEASVRPSPDQLVRWPYNQQVHPKRVQDETKGPRIDSDPGCNGTYFIGDLKLQILVPRHLHHDSHKFWELNTANILKCWDIRDDPLYPRISGKITERIPPYISRDQYLELQRKINKGEYNHWS